MRDALNEQLIVAPILRDKTAKGLAGLLHAVQLGDVVGTRDEYLAAAVLADEVEQRIIAQAFRDLAEELG